MKREVTTCDICRSEIDSPTSRAIVGDFDVRFTLRRVESTLQSGEVRLGVIDACQSCAAKKLAEAARALK